LIVIHGLHVDAVVLRVRPDELHPHDARLVLHLDHQPVLVAANVEHDAVVAADARGSVLVLDVLWGAPSRLDCLGVPAMQRSPGIGAARPFPEFLQAALGDDPHRRQYLPVREKWQLAPILCRGFDRPSCHRHGRHLAHIFTVTVPHERCD
jgi:hypothetical protein